jgi:hypothetical protein
LLGWNAVVLCSCPSSVDLYFFSSCDGMLSGAEGVGMKGSEEKYCRERFLCDFVLLIGHVT